VISLCAQPITFLKTGVIGAKITNSVIFPVLECGNNADRRNPIYDLIHKRLV